MTEPTEKTSPERRNNPRQQVSLWAEETASNARYYHLIQNISQGGLMLRKELPFPVGHTIHLELSLPGVLKKITLSGLVVDNYEKSGYKGAGIKFIQLGNEAETAIASFLVSESAHSHKNLDRSVLK